MLSPEVLDLIKRTVAELGLGAGAHTLEFGARSVPFSAPLTMRAAPGAPKPSVARRAVGDMAPEGDPAEGEPDGPEAPTSEMTVYRLSGTASSTSVDWYGTEMSRSCLDDMAPTQAVTQPERTARCGTSGTREGVDVYPTFIV
jgi:hypothetical protein